METKDYLELSEKTLSTQFHITTEREQKLLHAAIGLSTEANEILDVFKKRAFYGKEIDEVNLKEEIGDAMWYIAILLRELDADLHDIMQVNIDKLKARYGEKFSSEKAVNRDLETEREILEGK